LIAASDQLSKAVDDRRVALGTSLDGMATALDALSARRQQLTDLIDGVKGLSDHLAPLIQRNQGTLDKTLSDLIEVTQVLNDKKDRINIALDQLPDDIHGLRKATKQGPWINVYTIGFPGTPYLATPVDLGDNAGRNPGQSGGLPNLWLRPPPHDQSIDVGGIKVDTKDHSQPAPQGYWNTP
jgi:ABC-type transporter Mla subunit MlaD